MTWTYTGQPATEPSDAVRWHLGDVDASRPLAQDEDIAFALSLDSDPRRAAAIVATSLAARFARTAGITIDGISVDMAKKADEMRALATRLRAEAEGGVGGLMAPVVGPVVTGASVSAREDAARDTDRIPFPTERDFDPSVLDPLP